ncbi:hypothetical protein [Gracilibacillus phocaeensis]|uniref:hypothetical protein n=1 Tax=Gracilibacillus phocaeensis TaxID=2042304 RepID=UPI0013EF17CF|nr:hypothetical protein [Gracilibacillus phocaeensis]
MMTADMGKFGLQKEMKGSVCPFEITNLDELLSVINCPKLEVEIIENNIRVK